MTYFSYHLFSTLMTVLPILAWFAISVWIVLDADKMPDEAWKLSGESKNVWIALAVLLAWPFGLIFYVFLPRRKVAAIARTINEDALVTRAANRIRKQDAASAGLAPVATPAPHLQRVTVVEVPRNEVDEPEAPKASASEDETVFNYEESRPVSEEQESVATTVTPVIPPKPTHAPRIGTPEVDNK